VAHGPAVFVVRAVGEDGRITGVGLGFASEEEAPAQ
jgi:hypothetical protein